MVGNDAIVVTTTPSLRNPNKLSYKILLPKHIIAKQLQVSLLIIIDTDKDNTILGKQLTRQLQAWRHEHQPSRMSRATTACHVEDTFSFLFIHTQTLLQLFGSKAETVVIHKSVRARIVRRVDVDTFHSPCIRFQQVLQGIQVIATDINIFAILVFGFRVMLHIGHYHRCGIYRSYQVGIILTQEVERIPFALHIHLVTQHFLKTLQIERSIGSETSCKVLPQSRQLICMGLHVLIVFQYIFYHVVTNLYARTKIQKLFYNY